MLTTKDLQNTSKKKKKVMPEQPSQPTEKGQSVWEQWVSMPISNLKAYLLKGCQQLESTINVSNTSKAKLSKQLKNLQTDVVHVLTQAVTTFVICIFLLLLLMPLLVLFVGGHLLRLSHIVLTFIHTRLSQALTKLRIDT